MFIIVGLQTASTAVCFLAEMKAQLLLTDQVFQPVISALKTQNRIVHTQVHTPYDYSK